MSHYKFFDHTADIGVEVTGRTKKELFVNAAVGVCIIGTDSYKQYSVNQFRREQ
jgi:SHS2 domain-containing protein